MDDKTEELYFIACLRHRNQLGGDFLLLWGPDGGGYVTNIHAAGLYSKKEVEKICDNDDIPIPLSYLNIKPEELLPQKSQWKYDVWRVIVKTDRIIRYIKQQIVKYEIKERLRKRKILREEIA